jgi:hypothetical protein
MKFDKQLHDIRIIGNPHHAAACLMQRPEIDGAKLPSGRRQSRLLGIGNPGSRCKVPND